MRGSRKQSQVTLLNNLGKAVTIDTTEIEDSKTSRASLMPTNLMDQVSEEDLLNLLRWLNDG